MIKKVIDELIEKQKTMSIATITKEAHPYISYAPFVYDDNKIYFIISRTAQHFDNLIENEKIAVNILEDENLTNNIFFRKRLTVNGTVTMVEDKGVYQELLRNNLGEMIDVIFKMDFEVFVVEISDAKIVYGPGKAYFLDEKFDLVSQDTGNNQQNVDVLSKFPILEYNDKKYFITDSEYQVPHSDKVIYQGEPFKHIEVKETKRIEHIISHFNEKYRQVFNQKDVKIIVLEKR